MDPQPVSVGAWHWEHINSGGPNRTGYGIPPNVAGTFFWYLTLDPELTLGVGPFSKIGAHAELRIREQGLFRPYFSERFWSYEAYLWADSEVGRFKVGQIVRQFGLPGGGDGSFWATVPFWDGFNLNPSYGAAWEKNWKSRDDFSIDATAQFFFADDGVAGAAGGGNPESAPGARTPALGIVRVVPTWTFADKSTLAVGFSGSVGRVEHIQPDGSGDTLAAWEIDATYSWKGFQDIWRGFAISWCPQPDAVRLGRPQPAGDRPRCGSTICLRSRHLSLHLFGRLRRESIRSAAAMGAGINDCLDQEHRFLRRIRPLGCLSSQRPKAHSLRERISVGRQLAFLN